MLCNNVSIHLDRCWTGIWRVVFYCVNVTGWHVAAVLEQIERLDQALSVGFAGHLRVGRHSESRKLFIQVGDVGPLSEVLVRVARALHARVFAHVINGAVIDARDADLVELL